MTISLNRLQPADIAENHGSRIVPAAAVWEPVEAVGGRDCAPRVRRLGADIRTQQLGQAGLGTGSDSVLAKPRLAGLAARRADTPWIGETAQSYLVGGLFGLSLVIGAVLAGPIDEPVRVTPTLETVESVR